MASTQASHYCAMAQSGSLGVALFAAAGKFLTRSNHDGLADPPSRRAAEIARLSDLDSLNSSLQVRPCS